MVDTAMVFKSEEFTNKTNTEYGIIEFTIIILKDKFNLT